MDDLTHKITWIAVNDDEANYPSENQVIVFIGKMGEIGAGITKDDCVETGHGTPNPYYFNNIYAYAYLDVPSEIIIGLEENPDFKKSLFSMLLHGQL